MNSIFMELMDIFFFFQAEDGIRDKLVTGVQTCALPICRVGPTGKVIGIDASTEMTTRARAKAAKAAIDIDFRTAAAEALPFSNATFDVVLSTTVLHCLPDAPRRLSIIEMIRVLKSDGRLLVVDFGGPAQTRHSLMAHLSHHRDFDLHDLIPELHEAGLVDLQTGALGFSDLQFAIAKAP